MTLESFTLVSIATTVKHSRKEYLANWRKNNSDKVRQHKRNYYWTHRENEKERARITYQKNKDSTTSGRLVVIVCNNMPQDQRVNPTAMYRIMYIQKNGCKEICDLCKLGSMKTWRAFCIVKNELALYGNEVCAMIDLENVDYDKINKIRLKYPNLKPLGDIN